MKEYHLQRSEDLGLPEGTGKRYSREDIKNFINSSPLHKVDLDRLDDLKMNALFARIHHYGMITEAVVGSSAILASLPLTIEEVIPRWLTITMATVGVLIGPTALHETQTTYKWLQDAQKQVADFQAQN